MERGEGRREGERGGMGGVSRRRRLRYGGIGGGRGGGELGNSLYFYAPII